MIHDKPPTRINSPSYWDCNLFFPKKLNTVRSPVITVRAIFMCCVNSRQFEHRPLFSSKAYNKHQQQLPGILSTVLCVSAHISCVLSDVNFSLKLIFKSIFRVTFCEHNNDTNLNLSNHFCLNYII